MKTIVLRLDPETRARLEALAKARRRTPSSLVAEAVGLYVDREMERLVEEVREAGESDGPEEEKAAARLWNVRV